ncbi:unnamed protein product [Effrenium voratum]|nr:unnamed protein product [Effrenium voratum]
MDVVLRIKKDFIEVFLPLQSLEWSRLPPLAHSLIRLCGFCCWVMQTAMVRRVDPEVLGAFCDAEMQMARISEAIDGDDRDETLAKILDIAICYDALNVSNLASVELLARRRQLIGEAHAYNPAAPSYQGADFWLGDKFKHGGAIVAPALTQHVSKKLQAESQVLKERHKLEGAKNIDSLHQRAGSHHVIEIHGTMATARCMETGKQVPQSEILRQWVAAREGKPDSTLRPDIATDMWVPKHPDTGGVLKPDVTMFGEALPAGAFGSSWWSVLSSPVCLVVGTGLNVFPANLVPGMVRWRFGTLIVLNKDSSGASSADIFLQGSAGELLPKLVDAVKQRLSAL